MFVDARANVIDLTGCKMPKLKTVSATINNKKPLFFGSDRITRIILDDCNMSGYQANAKDFFSGACKNLAYLDAKGWNLSKAANLDDLVNGKTSLKKVDFTGAKFTKAESISNAFKGCSSLTDVTFAY